MALSTPSTTVTTPPHHLPQLFHPHSSLSGVSFPTKRSTGGQQLTLWVMVLSECGDVDGDGVRCRR
ncbi:hypothetical protein HanRHA438_Chr00c09g0847801 [Helianthus annuus]|nr:hypothetical protein HanRHA438_Chr00c09g0847801 [Helianthus annuus]